MSGKILVESPSSGASFEKNTNQLIQWRAYGNAGSFVRVELLKSGQFVSTILSSASANANSIGSCVWRIPSNIEPGNDYQIKVVSTKNPEIYGISQPFTIIGPSIKLTSPGSGETWYTGTVQKIAWTYSGVYPISLKIECLRENFSSVIAQVYTNKTADSYQWYIPSTLPASSDYRIRITAINDTSITTTSDAFTISNGSIILLSPSGNEVWKTGEIKNIVWRFTGNPGTMVRVELYRGEKYVGLIGAKSIGTGNTGSFLWKIPQKLNPGNDYRIKIVSTSNSSISATGNCFSIVNNNGSESKFMINSGRCEETEEYNYYK
ncbi:MAG: GPI anchored serine-threonine rich family protein, partial [Candidatus Omnitrophica bacterium]|nr:GPI anchored serine-threonine rich family protein [Candidatus Omnitrophota bacterium]